MAMEVLARIATNENIKNDVRLLTLEVPSTFAAPLPGQFVMLRPADYQVGGAPFLPRPFSVCGFENGQLKIIYRVVGKGTAWLAGLAVGAKLFIRGPLGNSFIVPPATKRAIVVTGGIGGASLLFFASYHRNSTVKIQFLIGLRSKDVFDVLIEKNLFEIQLLLGLRCKDDLLIADRIGVSYDGFKISTDDGSCGVCGQVTDMLPEELAKIDHNGLVIYACGPKEMGRSLARMVPTAVPCFVSLEERMACGIGACLGCALETINTAGKREMKRVCKDGPIFDIRRIVWK